MFTLKNGLAFDQANDLDDTSNIKLALTALGYHDDTDEGLSSYPTEKLFTSIKSFQKDNNLKVDGVIKADGPTQKTIRERLNESAEKAGAFTDFMKNYLDMRAADTIDADKYFHCKANYQASSRGWHGDETARNLSEKRESYGQSYKNENNIDRTQDLIANGHGRHAARSEKYQSAEEACAIFRPKGLDEKY